MKYPWQSDGVVLGYLDGSADEQIPGIDEGTDLVSSVDFSEGYIYVNLDNYLNVISMWREYGTALGYSNGDADGLSIGIYEGTDMGYLVSFYEGSKYGSIDGWIVRLSLGREYGTAMGFSHESTYVIKLGFDGVNDMGSFLILQRI